MIPSVRSLVLVTIAALALQSSVPANAQAPAPAKPEAPAPAKPEAPAPTKTEGPAAKPPAPKPVVVQPKRFTSPEEATQAFVAALRAGDTKALLGILGSEGRTLVTSGDPVGDRRGRERFVDAYDAGHKLVANGDTVTLQVGADDWPLPIPLVKQGERWRFDARQGRAEIIARRIGRNELYAMQTCLAIVDAQREYYAADHNNDGVLEYARQFGSAPGKRDGLYWPTQPGEPLSPLGDLVVRARAEGYRRGEGGGPTPFYGYLYRILTSQGPAAPGGEYDYVVRGHMIAGFALVAFPAQYGVSGVMTFIVNHDGVVYQKDLGPSTRSIAFAMRTFNPDGTWAKAEVQEVSPPAADASR
jgi:hypothetical protein